MRLALDHLPEALKDALLNVGWDCWNTLSGPAPYMSINVLRGEDHTHTDDAEHFINVLIVLHTRKITGFLLVCWITS